MPELEQIRKYAMAIVDDRRFDLSRTQFEFVVLSTGITKEMRLERQERPPNIGLARKYENLPVRLWVRTWPRRLTPRSTGSRTRQEQFAHQPTEEQAFNDLRTTYADRLPPTVSLDATA